MEGASIYGLTACVTNITAKDGRIQQSNFNEYQVVRMPDAPKQINVYIVNDGNEYPPGGVGEPGTPPFAPALCNAIFAATGKRILELPISQGTLAV